MKSSVSFYANFILVYANILRSPVECSAQWQPGGMSRPQVVQLNITTNMSNKL